MHLSIPFPFVSNLKTPVCNADKLFPNTTIAFRSTTTSPIQAYFEGMTAGNRERSCTGNIFEEDPLSPVEGGCLEFVSSDYTKLGISDFGTVLSWATLGR